MTKRIKLILLIIIGSISTACAQQQYYDWRLGAGVGGSYYLGDLSYGLNRNAFAAPAWQVMLGRTISPSFGLELNGTWATLAGNDRTMGLRGNLLTNNPNLERGFSFQTTVRSASLQLHYRFNNGVLLSRYARFAPYIFAGAGIADFRVNNGPETGADFPAQVATIPAGAGLQVRLADRLSANVRAEARYAFTDYLDNVSTGSNRNDMFFLGTVSLQYHFNWGKRKPFKAPTVYVGYEQPSMAMARQTPAGNSPATASGNTPGQDWDDISRIPASRKGEISRIQPSPGVSAPDRLPGQPDTYRTTPGNTRTNTRQPGNTVLQGENYESQFNLRRPSAASDQAYTNHAYAGNQPYVGNQLYPAGGQNLRLDNQRNELRRRQEENNAAIRRSEEELERLRTQVRESSGARTNTQPDNRQETELRRLSNDEEMRSVALNNRLTGLDNDLQRLRRENEAYRRQLRRINQGQVAGDLAMMGAMPGQNQVRQMPAGANPETQARLDSLTRMVDEMRTQLNASGNTAPATDTLSAPSAGEPENMDRLMSSLDQLDDQELDSLYNQLAQVRQMMTSLENQLAGENTETAPRIIAPYGSLVVYYPLNSAVIGEADRRRLDVLAERVKANPSALIRLNGHTDNTGNAEYNLRLSHERAGNIRNYLVSNAGIPANRVIINYYGQQQASGEGQNPYARKVELELYVAGNGNQN